MIKSNFGAICLKIWQFWLKYAFEIVICKIAAVLSLKRLLNNYASRWIYMCWTAADYNQVIMIEVISAQ